jgi:hypothetical protein
MISVHWIPAHRGQEDKERFERWQPPFVKIVCVDEKPPYTEDVPPGAKIIIRNHPMSELYGNRWLTGLEIARQATETENIQAKYETYFKQFYRDRTAHPFRNWTSSAVSGSASPEQVGVEHAATCQRMAQYCESKGVARGRLLFEGLNEPQLWANEPPDKVARYYKSFLAGLHGYGLRGVVGNFGVGWPGNGGVADAPPAWDFFWPVIQEMQAGDYLGLHEYWALQGPQQNWRWWGGRFLQCPYTSPILVTECGIDTGVTGNYYGGWFDLPGSLDAKAARYVDELWWYAKQCAADGRVKGILPFTYDIGEKAWEKFNTREQPWLEAFYAQLESEGMPQPGVPDPVSSHSHSTSPSEEPTVSTFEIVAVVKDVQPNEVSYIEGTNRMVDKDGNFVKPMQKPVDVRWVGETDPDKWMHPNVDASGHWWFTPAQNDLTWAVRTTDDVQGITSGWHTIELVRSQVKLWFTWTPVEEEYATLEDALEGEAEKHDVLSINPDSAFCKVARTMGIWPTSNEFDFVFEGDSYRVQRFRDSANDDIWALYCINADWSRVYRYKYTHE